MKRAVRGILILVVLVASVALVAPSAMAQRAPIPMTVNCSNGQSLNGTLAQLNRHTAFTVSVSGTCTEFVRVADFQDLTLKGIAGATLVQPSTGAGNLVNAVLFIESSQGVTVDGLSIKADTVVDGIVVGHGSSNIQLRNLNITGGSSGISIFERSQVLLANVTAQDSTWALLGIYDLSDVHIEHCIFEFSAGALYQPGIFIGASHITMFDTRIKNMSVGILGYAGSIIDVTAYSTYTPPGGPSDVIIENPAGTNYQGVQLSGGSSLNVSGARLLINNAGQSWGGTSAGVFVNNGSTLTANTSNLVITGSQGQGIMVTNNSHATLAGVTVTGSGHGGLVAANHGSIDVTAGTPSLISGNTVDIFVFGTGILTGAANVTGATTIQAFYLYPGPFDSGGLP